MVGIICTPATEGNIEIPGIVYRGETGTWKIFEKMAPEMNANESAEYSEREKQEGRPHLADSIFNIAMPRTVYHIKDKYPEQAEKFRQLYQEGLRKYPSALTMPVYNPEGQLDKAVHNFGTSDEYSIATNLVGSDGWIDEMSDKKVLEAFLGTDNVDEINKVSQWINGTDTYIWRLNSKPEERDERVVGFGAYSVRLGLGCYRYPSGRCPGFRVLRVE